MSPTYMSPTYMSLTYRHYCKEKHEFTISGSFFKLVFQTMSLYVFLEYIFYCG